MPGGTLLQRAAENSPQWTTIKWRLSFIRHISLLIFPHDTGYVLIICIHGLKFCIDINKERTVSSNHGFYIYLNHCRRVQADYLPHGSGWCLIGLCVEYFSLLRRSDRSTWSNAAQPPVTFARWCPWPQYHACCFLHPSWWLDFFCG